MSSSDSGHDVRDEPARSDGHEYLTDMEFLAWHGCLSFANQAMAALDAALRGAHNISLSEFDVLITLYNAPDKRLGMSALGERVLLSPAGTTHLVTRLERDGLVRREVDPTDRRKWFTVLTDRGDEALRDARQTHNAVLRRTILAAVTPAERRTLQRVWKRLSEQHPTPTGTAN
jgi:DNA-binding MarR family transcriptional regulator